MNAKLKNHVVKLPAYLLLLLFIMFALAALCSCATNNSPISQAIAEQIKAEASGQASASDVRSGPRPSTAFEKFYGGN
jgi:hypothetical protein